MIINKINNRECKNVRGLATSLKPYNLTVIQYMMLYDNFIIPQCEYCQINDCKFSDYYNDENLPIYYKFCNNKDCYSKHKSKISSEYKVTEETKNKIRKSRVEYLKQKERKLTAYEQHGIGKMSFGEQWLNDIFINERLYEKFDIVNEFCEFPYFIDFAFVNEKVAIEYDGTPHFKNGEERIEKDIIKDKYLIEKGWRIFRIAYFEMKTFKLEDLLNFIGNSKEKQFSDQLIKYKEWKLKRVKIIKLPKGERLKVKNRISYKHLINQIENSNIDFSKSNWPGEVAKIMNTTSNKVTKWMKIFMPEFYENKVIYKRKGNKTPSGEIGSTRKS